MSLPRFEKNRFMSLYELFFFSELLIKLYGADMCLILAERKSYNVGSFLSTWEACITHMECEALYLFTCGYTSKVPTDIVQLYTFPN